MIPAIKESNDHHRGWALRRLESRFGLLRTSRIAVLGLAYKPDTSALRRSVAIELCRELVDRGASVRAYDPAVTELPADLSTVTVCRSLESAIEDSAAAAVCTEWAEFRAADWNALAARMRQPVVIDAGRFLSEPLRAVPRVEHLSVGRGRGDAQSPGSASGVAPSPGATT